jgi:hypothetical protein
VPSQSFASRPGGNSCSCVAAVVRSSRGQGSAPDRSRSCIGSPGHPQQLVGYGDDDHVLMGAIQQLSEPTAQSRSLAMAILQDHARPLHKQSSKISVSPFTSSRCLPPVEYSRGTIPTHAAKSRPLRKLLALPTAATSAVAVTGPIPGMAADKPRSPRPSA